MLTCIARRIIVSSEEFVCVANCNHGLFDFAYLTYCPGGV